MGLLNPIYWLVTKMKSIQRTRLYMLWPEVKGCELFLTQNLGPRDLTELQNPLAAN